MVSKKSVFEDNGSFRNTRFIFGGGNSAWRTSRIGILRNMRLLLYTSSSFYFRPYRFQTNWTNTKGSEITLSPEKDSIFGILALTFLVDVWDALLKGNEYTPSLGVEYPVRTIAYLVLCLLAIFINNQRFQVAFLPLSLLYQVSWILRLYHGFP
jgi:hypothetical protein